MDRAPAEVAAWARVVAVEAVDRAGRPAQAEAPVDLAVEAPVVLAAAARGDSAAPADRVVVARVDSVAAATAERRAAPDHAAAAAAAAAAAEVLGRAAAWGRVDRAEAPEELAVLVRRAEVAAEAIDSAPPNPKRADFGPPVFFWFIKVGPLAAARRALSRMHGVSQIATKQLPKSL